MPTFKSNVVAGDLRFKLGFFKRVDPAAQSPPPPDYGFPEGPWPPDPNFIKSANIMPRLGGEAILAARLTGKNFVTITVRQDSDTKQVSTDWKCKDMLTNDEYNIRSIIDPEHSTVRHSNYLELLAEKGVAI